MNSMKRTLTLLSFALLGVSFFATTSVQAASRGRYCVFAFTNAFKAINGTYNVRIFIPTQPLVDFNFSIKQGVISNITGNNANIVQLIPEDQALRIDVAGYVGSLTPGIQSTITITGIDGDLKGAMIVMNDKGIGSFNKSIPYNLDLIFAVDCDVKTKKIIMQVGVMASTPLAKYEVIEIEREVQNVAAVDKAAADKAAAEQAAADKAAAQGEHYFLEFTNAFKAIDGMYDVHIYFNRRYRVDFNFSIKNGVIGPITGTHADHVTLNPKIQTLAVELSSAIKWTPLQMSVQPPTITITGTAGALDKSTFTISVANPWLKNATVDIFTVDEIVTTDGNVTTKKIAMSERELKISDYQKEVATKEAAINVSQPVNPPISGLSREIEIAAPSK